ncbi:MAG: transposase [Verrucomicrobiaceae bacterium]|nr:transposase [Verrucomicrobiaceae bacterium]
MRRIKFQPFNPGREIEIKQRNMPHWTQEGVAYFVTFRLADSIPAALLNDWIRERDIWLQWNREPWSKEQREEYAERFGDRMEQWLDAGMGECVLRAAEVRAQLETHVLHFDGERYDIDCFVLMPNHVHLIVVPRPGERLFDILKGIKGTSARTCNKLLGKTGTTLWMEDSYNRIVRDVDELIAFRRYIERNPAQANLRDEDFTLVMNDVLYW